MIKYAVRGPLHHFSYDGKLFKTVCEHTPDIIELPSGVLIRHNKASEKVFDIIQTIPDDYQGYVARAVALTLQEQYTQLICNTEKHTGINAAAIDIQIWLATGVGYARSRVEVSLEDIEVMMSLIQVIKYHDPTLVNYLRERRSTFQDFLNVSN